jgi:hypothetical protein
MEYTIKPEFVGKTVKIYDRFQGTKTIVINNLDLSKVKYYQTIGLKHVFEEVVTVTAPGEVYLSPSQHTEADKLESTVIEYTAVEDVPVKKKRTKKVNTDNV